MNIKLGSGKGRVLGGECQSCGMLTLTGWFHEKRKGRGMETGGWLCYLRSSLVTFRDGLSCTTATQNKQTAGHPKAGTAPELHLEGCESAGDLRTKDSHSQPRAPNSKPWLF